MYILLESKTNRATDGIQDFNTSSVLPSSTTSSPATSSPSSTSIQFVVVCSSKEARVYISFKNKTKTHKISYLFRLFHCHLKFVYLNKKYSIHLVHLHQISFVHQ